MIDWYQGLIGYDGSMLRPEAIAIIDREGVVKWSKDRNIEVPGSYYDKIHILPAKPTAEMIKASEKLNLECAPTCIYFQGNPSKFLQGHNVFGPAVKSLAPVLTETVRRFPGELRPGDADSGLFPAVHRNRVDITTSSFIGSHAEAHQFLNYLGHTTRSRNGRAILEGTTVYWSKHSTLWTLKMYCKACELKAHKPPRGDFSFRDNLIQYCEGQVRIELCLRTLELKPRGTLHEDLIWEYLKRIEGINMKKRSEISKKELNLKQSVQFTLMKWKAGVDVRFTTPRPTFYRHRLAILRETSLDISIPYTPEIVKESNIDVAWLKAHEIKVPPEMFQKYIFTPEDSPEWPASPGGVIAPPVSV